MSAFIQLFIRIIIRNHQRIIISAAKARKPLRPFRVQLQECKHWQWLASKVLFACNPPLPNWISLARKWKSVEFHIPYNYVFLWWHIPYLHHWNNCYHGVIIVGNILVCMFAYAPLRQIQNGLLISLAKADLPARLCAVSLSIVTITFSTH